VLAQEVTGYAGPQCSGAITFTYMATSVPMCVVVTNPGTRSVNVPEDVICRVFTDTVCGDGQSLVGTGCRKMLYAGSSQTQFVVMGSLSLEPVAISAVRSVMCVGNGNDGGN